MTILPIDFTNVNSIAIATSILLVVVFALVVLILQTVNKNLKSRKK